MLAAKRSAGVTPEVTLGEHVTHILEPSANRAAHSGFETRRTHHQKSPKQRYPRSHKNRSFLKGGALTDPNPESRTGGSGAFSFWLFWGCSKYWYPASTGSSFLFRYPASIGFSLAISVGGEISGSSPSGEYLWIKNHILRKKCHRNEIILYVSLCLRLLMITSIVLYLFLFM